jgi:transposase
VLWSPADTANDLSHDISGVAMPIIKQVIGVDVSSESLVVCCAQIDDSQQISVIATATFANSAAGFKEFHRFASTHRRRQAAELPLWVVMEATGVYHEKLATTLIAADYHVSIVLANKIKHYALSLNLKSKTDRIDAVTIARYGLERQLSLWQPASELLSALKSLVREHENIQTILTEVRNRLHALQHSATASKPTLKRLRQQRDLLEKQRQQIDREITALISSSEELSESASFITSIPGVGLLTAAGVLAETNQFDLIDDAKQLISYSGLDPKLHESGKWKGQTHISHRGNSHLRRILYMPALSAIRHNKPLRALYERLAIKKGKKMVAVIAVMRKLLELIYTLWKKRQYFDPNYQQLPTIAAVTSL